MSPKTEFKTLKEIEGRVKTLDKRKKQLLITSKRARKTLAKAKAEKNVVNDEIKRLRNARDIFKGMSDTDAQNAVVAEIKATLPSDIFPHELEKEFDALEEIKPKFPNAKQVTDLGFNESNREEEDFISDEDTAGEGVLDMYYEEA